MQIVDIRAEKMRFELVKPVVIALGTITHGETVIVKVSTDGGICGFGEGAGTTFVTGETNDTVIAAVELLKRELIGLDPLSIEHIHRVMDRAMIRNASAKAAIDIALHDIMAKNAKAPLYKLLGGTVNQIETDMTIMIDEPEVMSHEARELVERGFRFIKVKAGVNPDMDIEAIRQIRSAVGPSIHIKMDANQGWSANDCLRVMHAVREYGVDAIEQPVPYWDIDGLAYIRSKAPIKLMADESCFTPQDAMTLVKRDAVDIINIKLMKCGGLYRAAQINSIAEAAGVRCMLGCMLESKVAISAGAALVAARPNFLYGDLDSFLYFKDNSRIKGGFSFQNGKITFGEAYGLGIEVDM